VHVSPALKGAASSDTAAMTGVSTAGNSGEAQDFGAMLRDEVQGGRAKDTPKSGPVEHKANAHAPAVDAAKTGEAGAAGNTDAQGDAVAAANGSEQPATDTPGAGGAHEGRELLRHPLTGADANPDASTKPATEPGTELVPESATAAAGEVPTGDTAEVTALPAADVVAADVVLAADAAVDPGEIHAVSAAIATGADASASNRADAKLSVTTGTTAHAGGAEQLARNASGGAQTVVLHHNASAQMSPDLAGALPGTVAATDSGASRGVSARATLPSDFVLASAGRTDMLLTDAMLQPATPGLLADAIASLNALTVTSAGGSESLSVPLALSRPEGLGGLSGVQTLAAAPLSLGAAGAVLDTQEGNWLPQLATDLLQIREQGDSRMRINLAPAHLGMIDCEIMETARGIELRVITESGVARDLLQDNSQDLRQRFQDSGLTLADFHCESDRGGAQAGDRNADAAFGQQGQHSDDEILAPGMSVATAAVRLLDLYA